MSGYRSRRAYTVCCDRPVSRSSWQADDTDSYNYNGIGTQTEQFALPAVEPQSFRDRGTSPRRSNRMYDSYDSSQMTPPGSSSGRMMVPHNNYYQRIGSPRKSEGYQSYPDGQEYVNKVYRFSGNPSFRSGRLGGPWRHVVQCTGNLGNHICFVDGQVKQSDMVRFPPYGYPSTTRSYNSLPVRSSYPGAQPNKSQKPANRFNKHAKNGFKYWFEEKQPGPDGPVQTIGGRLMKLGVGF